MVMLPPPMWSPHSNWRPTVFLKFFFALILLACTAFAQERVFKGKLEPELILPARIHQVSDFALATQSEMRVIAGMVGPGDKVFTGHVRDMLAFVVEAAGGSTIVYVDVNANGRIGANEAFGLRPGLDSLQAGIATVLLPLPGPHYKHYPINMYVYRKQKREDSRIVGESPRAFVRARADVNGKPLIVEYEFDQKSKSVHIDSGWQAMDVNRDREIDRSPPADVPRGIAQAIYHRGHDAAHAL